MPIKLTELTTLMLALLALIGIIIVPIQLSDHTYFIQFLLGAGKVIVSLIFVLIWLIGWYKAINYLLYLQFYIADLNSSPKDS
ncbi:MAG: hypothetical protein ACC656_12355 [Candidatus Heimdallarchaeota archaeon]